VLAQTDAAGLSTALSWTEYGFSTSAMNATRPVINSAGEIYWNLLGGLGKYLADGTQIWYTAYPPGAGDYNTWTLGPDQYGGVHVADTTGALRRYDVDGNLVWTINLPGPATAMAQDAFGNRFVSCGPIVRLGAEPLVAPTIPNPPQGLTVFAGSNAVLSALASGSTPFRYSWWFNGTPVPNATNSTLNLSGISVAQAGLYAVAVSNWAGSVTSAPVAVRVKQVGVFLGSQLLTNGTYALTSPPTLAIYSAFPHGTILYTLDGSAPNLGSPLYTNPFTLWQTATVRALGYSADFSQSETADPVTLIVPPQHTLTATTAGGGSISLTPPGGIYPEGAVVTATATPQAGWSFLRWLGGAAGTSPSVSVTMSGDEAIQAVFGTTLSTTVAGNGHILLAPPGGTYAYGTVVRLTALPQAGSYFGLWGNAASGSANPLFFTVTNATQTVSSLFAPTPAGQVTLAVLINGAGEVTANPAANLFAPTDSVTLTAVPDPGQRFYSWSGDALGTQTSITLAMTQNRVVTANFASRPVLVLNRVAGDGMTAHGFQFTISSDPRLAWQILTSTDQIHWQNLGTVTNVSGRTTFTDAAVAQPTRYYKAAPWP